MISSSLRYIVIRRDPHGPWTAALGVGGHMVDVPGACTSRAEAERKGRAAWTAAWVAYLDGLTLREQQRLTDSADWVDAPTYIYPRPGEPAWDALERRAHDPPPEQRVQLSRTALARQRRDRGECTVCGQPSPTTRCAACAAEAARLRGGEAATEQLLVRVTPTELATIKTGAAARNQSVSEYVRRAVLERVG